MAIESASLTTSTRNAALLDEAFEGIATAKANAQKNLLNAREVFEEYAREVFTRRGDGWADRKLDQVCKVERGSSPRPIKRFFTTAPDGVNWIKISDTEEGGKYVFTTAQKITPEGAKQSRYVKEDDFILTNSMSYGRPYIMKTSGYIHDGWFVLRLREEVDADYLYYLLSSQFVQAQFAALASGSVVKNISGDLVKQVVLTIPSLIEQKAIVEKFVALSQKTDSLAEFCRRKLAALEELKKSLLHQAFSGQLTSATRTSIALPQPLETTTPHFSANVIALAFVRHEKQKREMTFGRVKEQKVLHLVEAVGGIELGRQPFKDAAGPNDFAHMLKAEQWAKENHFFEMVGHENRYSFRKLKNFDALLTDARKSLAPVMHTIERVVDHLVPMDKEEAEVFTTVLAAWNNLLSDGAEVTDIEIVLAARDRWHADKLAIPKVKFQDAIELIRRKGLVPNGTAKYVGGQSSLL
jgi:Type I restriction modification DNA specificity domain